MMEFRTRVDLPTGLPSISHAGRILLMGSCFAENMGERLAAGKFAVDVNPYGILYNPLSLSTALEEMLGGKQYAAADLFAHQGLWHSAMHHGSFSAATPEETLRHINTRLQQAVCTLGQAEWLMLTFGTAYVYEQGDTGRVVGNCHRLPERNFVRRLLSVDEIVMCYTTLIERLATRNPRLKLLLTVSPIRHGKDGMHANQLSKATLLLAADRLRQAFPTRVFYFPSYEIVLDELRDYRFYADDMLHPSPLAVQYLWECFGRTFFSAATQEVLAQIESIRRDLAHRPFRPEAEAYQRFLEQIVLKIDRLKGKCPYLDFAKEVELCHTRSIP